MVSRLYKAYRIGRAAGDEPTMVLARNCGCRLGQQNGDGHLKCPISVVSYSAAL